jgi:hypothetical protein
MDAEELPQPPPEGAPSGPSSLTDRLANIIAAPGGVFEEIKHAPVRASNWLAPLLLSCIATACFFCIAFSQPVILLGMQQQRDKAIQKQVATGKITQAQAGQAADFYERFMTPATTKILSAGWAVLSSVVGLFLMALAIWLAVKCCSGAGLAYMKTVEICGLALVLDVPQKILRSFLVLWKQNLLATASPTLFLANPSATNRTDLLLSLLDLGDFWWLAVLSLGVSKAGSIRYRNAACITFGIWFGIRIAFILLTPSQS